MTTRGVFFFFSWMSLNLSQPHTLQRHLGFQRLVAPHMSIPLSSLTLILWCQGGGSVFHHFPPKIHLGSRVLLSLTNPTNWLGLSRVALGLCIFRRGKVL